jgi:hypothetical protein
MGRRGPRGRNCAAVLVKRQLVAASGLRSGPANARNWGRCDEPRERAHEHAGNFLTRCGPDRKATALQSGQNTSTRIAKATGGSAKPALWRLKIMFWPDVTLLVSICALQTVALPDLFLRRVVKPSSPHGRSFRVQGGFGGQTLSHGGAGRGTGYPSR